MQYLIDLDDLLHHGLRHRVVVLAVLGPLHCLCESKYSLQVGLEDEPLPEGDGVELSHPVISSSVLFLLDVLEDDDLAEVVGLLAHHCLADEEVEQLVAPLQLLEDERTALVDVDSADQLEHPHLEHNLHLQDGLYRLLLGKVVVCLQEGEEVLLAQGLLYMVSNGVDGLAEVVVEEDNRIQGVDVVEVGLELALQQEAGIKLELLPVFEPEKLLEAVVVEDVDEELLQVGLDGLAVVAEQREQQFRVVLGVFVELPQRIIVV